MKSTSHEFALFVNMLDGYGPQLASGEHIEITDEDLYHRITRVLRLEIDESFIVFDTKRHAHLQIVQINKKTIVCSVIAVFTNPVYSPHITVFLSILKKDALEQAVYGLTELGANVIQLVVTDKVQRSWGGASEMERLQRLLIAAAEQSKNFALPDLRPPMQLEEALSFYTNIQMNIFCDVQGEHIIPLVAKSYVDDHLAYSLFIGPEGDLTFEEKSILKKGGFHFCRLTPTVLRSVQAVCLSVGIIRSL